MFKCHIAHTMTAEALAASQVEKLERSVSAVMRRLNERANFCRETASGYKKSGRSDLAQVWSLAAEQAETRIETVKALAQAEWFHPEEYDPDAISAGAQ